jgi:hypothetical protein
MKWQTMTILVVAILAATVTGETGQLGVAGFPLQGVQEALEKTGVSGVITRMVQASDGTVYFGTRSLRESYDGAIYRYSPGSKNGLERLLTLGLNAGDGMSSANPCLVDTCDGNGLLINIEANGAFPEKASDAQDTGNAFVYDASSGKLINLTHLDGKSGLYAEALAYVPAEKTVVVNVSELVYDKMPQPKGGTGRPRFLSLVGKELAAEQCPLAAKVYADWKYAAPALRVVDSQRTWQWVSEGGQFFSIGSRSPSETPVAYPLSGGQFYVTGQGLGTFVVDAKSHLVVKVSSQIAVGRDGQTGLLLREESAGKASKFRVMDVPQVFQNLAAQFGAPNAMQGTKGP